MPIIIVWAFLSQIYGFANKVLFFERMCITKVDWFGF